MATREQKRWQHHERNKTMRKVRKEIKRNRKPDRARSNEWQSLDLDDPDSFYDWEGSLVERVMPLGEQERRQKILTKALETLEKEEESEIAAEGNVLGGLWARVIEVSSGQCRVDTGEEELLCSFRGSLSAEDTGFTNVVAVGDEVIVSEDGAGSAVVERVLPRRTVLSRQDVFYRHLKQVIAANVDQLLIVSSWRDPPIWLELIDRYLIAAERNGLLPLVCVNKIDLVEDEEEFHSTLDPYRHIGLRVIPASALTGRGVDALREVLRDKITVVAGLSGVGKSSLLNAVQPGLRLETGEVSDFDSFGRHTTTQVSMYPLAAGGYVVDTPGIREFGLSGLHRRDLAHFYPEMLRFAPGCRFPDCSHLHEPNCAVKEAVAAGGIARTRYHNYRKIYETLPD